MCRLTTAPRRKNAFISSRFGRLPNSRVLPNFPLFVFIFFSLFIFHSVRLLLLAHLVYSFLFIERALVLFSGARIRSPASSLTLSRAWSFATRLFLFFFFLDFTTNIYYPGSLFLVCSLLFIFGLKWREQATKKFLRLYLYVVVLCSSRHVRNEKSGETTTTSSQVRVCCAYEFNWMHDRPPLESFHFSSAQTFHNGL